MHIYAKGILASGLALGSSWVFPAQARKLGSFFKHAVSFGLQMAFASSLCIAFVCFCFLTFSSDTLDCCEHAIHCFPGIALELGLCDFGLSSGFCGYNTSNTKHKRKDKLDFIFF